MLVGLIYFLLSHVWRPLTFRYAYNRCRYFTTTVKKTCKFTDSNFEQQPSYARSIEVRSIFFEKYIFLLKNNFVD